jgi:hypothetical protein
MGRMGRPLGLAVCLLCASVSTLAMQATLDRRAIEEAIQIGQSRFDAERNRLHAAYRVKVARSPVDWIDVLTPYYRVALAAEAQARLGDRVFGQREASAALSSAPNLLELLVELTFHPLNTYVGVPSYTVTLTSGQAPAVTPRYVNRYPRFGPRTDAGAAPAVPNPNAAPILGSGQPMLGGTLVAQFALDDLNANGRYDFVLVENGTEITRAAVDLGKMR